MSDLKQFQFTEATEEEDETYAKAKFLEVRHLQYQICIADKLTDFFRAPAGGGPLREGGGVWQGPPLFEKLIK